MQMKNHHLLMRDYSLVGYLLAPHPSVMQHCLVNKTLLHVKVAENCVKALLNPVFVDMEKEQEKVRIINMFHKEYHDFTCY